MFFVWASRLFFAIAPFFTVASAHAQADIASADELLRQSRNYKNSDISKSLELAGKSLEQSRALNYKNGIAQSIFHLSTLHIMLQENEKAEAYLLQSEKLFTELHDSIMLLKCLFNKAMLKKNAHLFDESIVQYRQLLGARGIAGAPEIKTGVYNNLGNIYREIGNLDSAYLYYAKALRENEVRKDEEGIQNSLVAVAAIYNDLKEYHTAINYTKRFLLSRQGLNDIRTATALHNIGITYYNLNEFDSSLSNLQRSLIIFEQIGDVASATEVKFAIGNCYFETNRFTEAQRFYSQALSESGKTGNSFHKAYSYYVLANLQFRKEKNIGLAEAYADSCLRILKEIDHKVLGADVALLMGDIQSAAGNYRMAAEYRNAAIRLRDSVYSESKRNLIIELDKRYDTERKNATIAQLIRQNEIKSLKIERKNLQIITVSAISLMLFLTGLLVYQYYAARNRQKRLELEQRLLLAQLNPHFIFNALSGIQHFVVTNKMKDAVLYLSSFGKLMRTVLENSREQFTTVEKEVTLLENYLNLQQLLQEFRFSYKVEIDAEDEEILSIEIPSMLLQPFTENAVKYAFREKKETNYILVSFARLANHLNIIIEDNGVGVSSAGKSISTSLGNTITADRIANFNRSTKQKITLQVIDKGGRGESETGTRVIISIPLSRKD